MLDLTSDPAVAANEMVIAKDMADILHNAYPRHIWAVNVDRAGGVAHVRNLALSGQWGFVIKLPDVYSASEMKRQVLQAGGEILERYRVKRGALDWDRIDELQTDVAGNPIADR